MGAVQLGDRLVGQRLHPVPERLLALDGPGRVGVRAGHRLVDGGAGPAMRPPPPASPPPGGPAPRSPRRTSRPGRPWRRGSTARRARSAPGRRPACPARAGPARYAGTGRTRRSPRSPPPHPGAAPRRACRSAPSRSTSPWKKLSPVGSTQMSHCLATSTSCTFELTCTGGERLTQRGLVALQRGAEAVEPGGDVGLVVAGRGGHQVEHHADLVQPAGDHADLAGHLAGVVPGEVQAEPFLHGLLGGPFRFGLRLGHLQLGERPAGEVRARPRSRRARGRRAGRHGRRCRRRSRRWGSTAPTRPRSGWRVHQFVPRCDPT